jgi:glycosyltransferase involved in cell wall biosynthesis
MYYLRFKVGLSYLFPIKHCDVNLKEYPSISFIIPTYNSQKTLFNCLSGISNQDYPKEKIDIIIADGGSSDDTVNIAKKFNCKILKNKKVIAEYGKAMGIKESKSDYFILLDSDNIIKDNNWLKKMIYPIQKERDIIGTESKFGVSKDMSSLDKYSARMRITDPLARMLVSNYKKIKKDKYSLLIFKKGTRVASGANGFLWNKKLVDEFWNKGDLFEEANFGTYLCSKGHCSYAIPDDTYVYHYHISSLRDFIKKRKKIGNKFLQRKGNRETWLDNVSKLKLMVLSLYLVSIIGPLAEALYKSIKDRDTSWFVHPITSFLTIWIYTSVYLNKRKEQRNIRIWS